jgi:putative PEP-CTERM system integral membrane protein
VSLVRLAGLTLMLLTALYAALWIAFYALPLAAELLKWVGRTVSNLAGFVRDLRLMWSDLIRQGLIWIPFTILGFVLAVFTATLFVLAPIAVPVLSVQAWRRSLQGGVRRQGWAVPLATVLATIGISALLFIIVNRQPQQQAFALLQNPPASPGQLNALVRKQFAIRKGLLNAYLSPFRYISSVGEVGHVRELYRSALGMTAESAAKVEKTYEVLAQPVLYRPVALYDPEDLTNTSAFQRESEQAAQLYQRFFDTTIVEGEREEIVRAARSTWASDQAEAAWQAVDDREVHLSRQEITVAEHGDWAEVELFEVYEDRTGTIQEVIYYFNLPESAVLTGVWLGESPDREERSVYQVAPRGAAQAVYRNEVRRGLDPALLEQIGPRQYRLRLFPVLPASIQWDEYNTRRISETARPLYVWMTYRTLAVDGAWPLPRLAFKNNVFWDGDTQRLINGQPSDENSELWMPESLPASAPVQPSVHRVDFPGGGSVLARPAAQVQLPGLPANVRLALVLDRSHSMEAHAGQVVEVVNRLKELAAQGAQVDLYLTASSFRGEAPARLALEGYDPQQEVYFGGQNPAELLSQYESLRAGSAYDGILVITDGTAYELGETVDDPPIPEAPVWMIHLGSDIPLGYDDRTLEAIQASGGGVVGSLDQALSRLALDLGSATDPSRRDMLLDGYVWTVLPAGEAQAAAPEAVFHSAGDPFNAIAARQFILAEMRRARGSITELDTLDYLHALADEYSLVTPYSSMIVLVTQNQQMLLDALKEGEDRFDREHEDLTNTTPATQAPLVGVPEPGEWLLFASALLLLGWYLYQQRAVLPRQEQR